VAFWGYSQGGGGGGSLRRRTRIKLCPGASHRRHIRRRTRGRPEGTPSIHRRQRACRRRRLRNQQRIGGLSRVRRRDPLQAHAPRPRHAWPQWPASASEQTLIDFAFRHLQPCFDEDCVAKPSTRSRSAVCWICRSSGAINPTRAWLIDSNRLRPTRALDGGQPARQGLVCAGRRRRISYQRKNRLSSTSSSSNTRSAHARRRRARHAVDRRPLQLA